MDQLLSAISVVSDPSQHTRELHVQAIEYLNSVRSSPSESWQLALNLFVDAKPDGTRTHVTQIRVFALQILDDLLNNRVVPLESDVFEILKTSFLTYIQQEFIYGSAEANAPYIRNKFSHTLALLFLCVYPHQWPDFFPTIYQLLHHDTTTSSATASTAFNLHVSSLFFHVLIEISGEVADTILKGAREFAEDRHRRDGIVRDQIRERDSKGISEAVLAIISDSETHLVSGREKKELGDQRSLEDIIGLAIKAFACLIPWINVNFTVTPDTLPLLFRLLSDPALPIRIETANAFLRMIQKGLKEPGDKLQLIRVLSLAEVLTRLEEKTRGNDEDLPFREGLGKLANGLGLETSKLVDEATLPSDLRSAAQDELAKLLPVILRFLGDEWDDTSVTVHPFLSTLLGTYKRGRKQSPQTHLTLEKKEFLSTLLEVVLLKMKWDKDADPENMDEDEKLAFESMRKDLRAFVDSIITIDEGLCDLSIHTLVMNTLQTYQSGATVSWENAELAVYLVYLYGELQKIPRGPSQFVQIPSEMKMEAKNGGASGRKPRLNYARYPLTAHGELMMALVQSDICSYPHSSVVMQFFEAVGRYGDFFRTRKECASPVLSAFIDVRGIHHPRTDLRGRLFYLFHRFIKDIRSEIPHELVATILNSIGDLMVLNVELPEPDSPGIDPLENAVNTPSLFDSQLYLFETVGTLLSLLSGVQVEQAVLLQTITNPLLTALSETLQIPMIGPQDVLPVLKVHHLIRALGNISKGFPDAPVPTPQNYTPPVWISVFDQVAEAVLVSLATMSGWKVVREATRFAFTRIIAAAGPATTKYIPTLMGRMLASCQPDELVEFIQFLGLVVHRLQLEVFDVLDELVGPLHNHMANLVAQPIDGTDARQEHVQTMKAYLDLLVNIMTGRLYVVLVSPRNKSLVESLCQFGLTVAGDSSDPPSQRVAWTLLARLTTHFGRSETQADLAAKERAGSGKPVDDANHSIPGYELFVYDRLIPLVFELPNRQGFNFKDAQTLQVLGECGTLLAATRKARGQEAVDFFTNVFLPSQNWPPEAISNFVVQLTEQDTKGFKKYWTDFVRSSLSASQSR